MRTRTLILLLAFILSPYSLLYSAKKPDALKKNDYKILSGKGNELEPEGQDFSKEDKLWLKKFAQNYNEKISLLNLTSSERARIPKIIHFIWIGPKQFPPASVANVESWKRLHPDWTFMFWTDNMNRPCPVEGMEKHHIDEIPYTRLKGYLSRTKNYGELADLIRYELIRWMGGLYCDHDVYCFSRFDLYHEFFDFYVGLENPHFNMGTETKVYPCNCLFGARPNHPIILQAIDEVVDRWDRVEQMFPGDDPINTFYRVILRTFHAFTIATKKRFCENGNIDMMFPSSYFFAHKLFRPEVVKKLQEKGLVVACHQFVSVWREK